MQIDYNTIIANKEDKDTQEIMRELINKLTMLEQINPFQRIATRVIMDRKSIATLRANLTKYCMLQKEDKIFNLPIITLETDKRTIEVAF